ncbi:MAG: hypothetical protein KDA68_22250 [Planctomycetaceae bacterium]|nr:hypothetical protein [Planctomycetaceae bacterium]
MGEIKAAWLKREQAVSSLVVEIRTNLVTPKQDPNSYFEGAVKVPAGVKVEERKMVRIKEEKFATLSEVVAGHESLRPHGARLAFDGVTALSYNGVSRVAGLKSTGVILADPYQHSPDAEFAPVFIQVRGLHPELHSVNLIGFTPVEGMHDVQGHMCVKLEKAQQAGYSEYLYCDPARDYLVRRREAIFQEKPVSKLEIELSDDSPIPSSWEFSSFRRDTGERVYNSKSKVVRFEINAEIPDSEFTFTFPDQTFVIDEISKTRYVIGEQPTEESEPKKDQATPKN